MKDQKSYPFSKDYIKTLEIPYFKYYSKTEGVGRREGESWFPLESGV